VFVSERHVVSPRALTTVWSNGFAGIQHENVGGISECGPEDTSVSKSNGFSHERAGLKSLEGKIIHREGKRKYFDCIGEALLEEKKETNPDFEVSTGP